MLVLMKHGFDTIKENKPDFETRVSIKWRSPLD